MPEHESPLRAAREAVAATRAELAVGSGVSARMIEAVERGECAASAQTWSRLEGALLRAACARISEVESAVGAVARLDLAIGGPAADAMLVAEEGER